MATSIKEISPERREMRRRNSAMSTLAVLAALKDQQPEIWEKAEVVGQWVWVEFEMRPSEQVREWLLDLGFHWNHARLCWQHACGKFSLHSRGNPRFTYLTATAKEFETTPQPATV